MRNNYHDVFKQRVKYEITLPRKFKECLKHNYKLYLVLLKDQNCLKIRPKIIKEKLMENTKWNDFDKWN